MAYLLDTNVFIAAKNLHYGLDFCPAFWDWLLAQNTIGKLLSIEKVADEMMGLGDDLSLWTAARQPGFFAPPDENVINALKRISSWVLAQGYAPAAVSTFLQVADYYLVGHALAYGHTVVTHEIASTSTKKIKIPNVCVGLKIKCMTPFAMLRVERAKFVLGR